MSNKIEIRLVRPEDNDKLAQIIRQVLTEFNANLPGTPFTDAKTDSL
ncbi:MAG: GNAT family N-acetyltransferase, partial [Zetaproteobacteria bacterium]|nr:GNAT family N-acetyltransferase [Flavobacteriales bacterium]